MDEYVVVRPAPADDNTLDPVWVRARIAECERWGCVNVAAKWREQLAWLEMFAALPAERRIESTNPWDDPPSYDC